MVRPLITGWADNRIPMNIQNQYLDGRYHNKNPTFHVEDSPWKAEQIARAITKYTLQPNTVAEVGCGAGEILVQLSQRLRTTSFFGYELSPQGYDLCKQRGTERLHYFNKDLLEDTGQCYDLVLCVDVLEHIEDCFTFLRRLKRHGRAFLFHIPLDMNVQMVLRSTPILRVRADVGHLHYFSKDTALATLSDCDYQIIDWFYTPNGAERPKSTKAKILQIPRKLLSLFNAEMTARVLGGYSLLVYARPKDV